VGASFAAVTKRTSEWALQDPGRFDQVIWDEFRKWSETIRPNPLRWFKKSSERTQSNHL